MTLIEESSFCVYFGSRIDRLNKKIETSLDNAVAIKRLMNAQTIVFSKQVHGIEGAHITACSLKQRPFHVLDQCADFLVSNEPGIAIGIITADCLPVVLFDSHSRSLAVVHAGWKGSVQRVVAHALERMIKLFKAQKKTMQAYLGSYARSCCYEVNDDVLAYIPNHLISLCTHKHEEKWYFDNGLFNKLQLLEEGVSEHLIFEEHSCCTICTPHFYSHRRDQGVGRQATVAVLR